MKKLISYIKNIETHILIIGATVIYFLVDFSLPLFFEEDSKNNFLISWIGLQTLIIYYGVIMILRKEFQPYKNLNILRGAVAVKFGWFLVISSLIFIAMTLDQA